MRHFSDGVNILDGAGKADGAYTAPGTLHGRPILAPAGENCALAADAMLRGDAFEIVDESHIGDHGAVHDVQADAVSSDGDTFFVGDAGRFAAESRVAGDGKIGVDSVGCGPGTAQADFFLDRPDGVDFAGVMSQVFDGANQSPAANAVVKALRNDGVSDFVERSVEHDHVANTHAAFGIFGCESAVDKEFSDFGDLLFIRF